MSDQEEMSRDTGALVRAALQASLFLGEHMARMIEAKRQTSLAQRTELQKQTAARLAADQRAAESFLKLTTTDAWWNTAGRPAIADAWFTAVSWQDQSEVAREAMENLAERIRNQYGIDPSSHILTTGIGETVPLTEQMLAEAAWRQQRRQRDDSTTLGALELAAIREGLDREALYTFVVLHEQASTELNRLANAAEDGSFPLDKQQESIAEQQTALAAAENALHGLGRIGEQWLREFDRDQDGAYARVLVAESAEDRAKMWDIGRRLAAVRANNAEVGDIGTDNDQILALHAEMAAVGDAGVRWLASHRTSITSADPEFDRSLAWMVANPQVEQAGLDRMRDQLTSAMIGAENTDGARPADPGLVAQMRQAFHWYRDNDQEKANAIRRHMTHLKDTKAPVEERETLYQRWISQWKTDTSKQKTAGKAPKTERGPKREQRPKGPSLNPAEARYSDAELRAAMDYYRKHDPEQMRKWLWKMDNMPPEKTKFGRISVENEMVERWRRDAHDTPERRAILEEQLEAANVPEDAKRARMAADAASAHPPRESTRPDVTVPPTVVPPTPSVGINPQDFDLGA
ncbi:hypothetical protein ACFVVM_32830 [Nocardia sp. NPDC058176]|uniref:hypothetical protein n=1 Tax=Nocardia sp. NPDC058176 TaxID=3346368 RepID=UPI0036D9D5A1